jgi:hypothetical protein
MCPETEMLLLGSGWCGAIRAMRHQINPTFRPIVLITESISPLNTCLAMLQGKPW